MCVCGCVGVCVRDDGHVVMQGRNLYEILSQINLTLWILGFDGVLQITFTILVSSVFRALDAQSLLQEPTNALRFMNVIL